jgi:hypothetical protein
VGISVNVLIVEWDPFVEAVRASGGFGFFWEAHGARSRAFGARDWRDRPPALPYVTDYSDVDMWLSGQYIHNGVHYYPILQAALPPDVVEKADAFHTMVLWDQEPPDDLATDAGLPDGTPDRMYTMRPATVRTALARADQVPWDRLEQYGEQLEEFTFSRYQYDYVRFRSVVEIHLGLLREAAGADRGIVVLVDF